MKHSFKADGRWSRLALNELQVCESRSAGQQRPWTGDLDSNIVNRRFFY